MTRHHGFVAAALLAATASCGYPSFQFGGVGGSGGGGGATTSTSTTTSGPPPCPGHLVISELRTRGPNGGDDDFVELYNPTDQGVVLGNDWTIQYQGVTDSPLSFTQRWAGQSNIIPAHGHYLIGGSTYASSGETPARDGALMTGISDEGAIFLVQGLSIIDTVCFFHIPASQLLLEGHGLCEGTPVENPHDDTTGTNSRASLAREPRDCTDTDHNDADFQPLMTSTPMSSQSPPIVY